MRSRPNPFPGCARIYKGFTNLPAGLPDRAFPGRSLFDTMLVMDRRKFFHSTAAAGAAGLAAAALSGPALAQPAGGRLNQSVCYWTYQKWFTLDQLCQEAVRIGLKGIDLVTPAQYATVQKHGLAVAMTAGTTPNDIGVGLNRVENHDRVLQSI